MLANGTEAVDPRFVEKRFALALALGLSGGAFLMVLLLGVRHDLMQVIGSGMFWLKVSFPVAVICATLSVTSRLARPGRTAGVGWIAFGVVLAAFWLSGIAILTAAPPELRSNLALGKTWRVCAACVTLLSIPAFGAVFWALRGLAPTRERQTGTSAGLLAGAQGLLVYCFHCPETALPFWAIWYTLGMLVPAAIGAALGKVLLRW
ncbi:conserved hypothetical protein [Janthinobacterium agaricidamnosum NBRC 102515 = DSM 9628]|uniref:Transmembrane protein n=2 Tax=Janthinobacterium agaricidamnosum TaxID=55508 RepID=W0VA83_9BURK|nr:conserved hypothetical protein [Janthinobacterium agaricidamnosum NBRC 102515 = DSM 9628]